MHVGNETCAEAAAPGQERRVCARIIEITGGRVTTVQVEWPSPISTGSVREGLMMNLSKREKS